MIKTVAITTMIISTSLFAFGVSGLANNIGNRGGLSNSINVSTATERKVGTISNGINTVLLNTIVVKSLIKLSLQELVFSIHKTALLTR